ncbi:alpha/beta hydrolase [uncultured Sulfitobacter sp.]|uniref:alpha/beta fold hydrolase n=1 Tax=uncultured Sulfitobacter sp. TaxID=191468 RepID=UPI00261B9FE5|nr:alpha/beta hydrolase [uncultured Sulfitobacter sp.]
MNAQTSRYVDAETQFLSVNGTRFAYRTIGPKSGVPIVMFNHLAGTIDDWDPSVVDGLAAQHQVLTFDNRGIGGSEGATPQTVAGMADDGIAFIKALGLAQVYMLGFSLGGAVVQDIVFKEPELAQKIILGGIGPRGGIGIRNIPGQAYRNQLRSLLTFTDIRVFLFFTRTENGKRAARRFLSRLSEKKTGRVRKVSIKSFRAQLAAIAEYASSAPPDLSRIAMPTFVANGEHDIMVPSVNSAHLMLGIPNARLSLYKDAGHGGIFQYHDQFVEESLAFLSE